MLDFLWYLFCLACIVFLCILGNHIDNAIIWLFISGFIMTILNDAITDFHCRVKGKRLLKEWKTKHKPIGEDNEHPTPDARR